MSSVYVRTQIENFIAVELPGEVLIDLTGESGNDIENVLKSKGVTYKDPWLGINYLADADLPVTIGTSNTSGKFRESGLIYLHVVAMATNGVKDVILPRAEAIRNVFRGMRIGDIIIESISPPNFEAGSTLSFESGWTAASLVVDYYRDLDF